MSAFDTCMACTQNMQECLVQNHFETPPYGPVPDAAGKLRTAVRGMIEALITAMDAESRGIAMPPVPEVPVGEAIPAVKVEHEGHREHALALATQPETAPEPEMEPAYVPPEEPDDEL